MGNQQEITTQYLMEGKDDEKKNTHPGVID